MQFHKNTKLRKAKQDHKCSKCKNTIPKGQYYYYTNTKFIKPFRNCVNCCPTKQDVTDMVQDEMQNYHNENNIDYED